MKFGGPMGPTNEGKFAGHPYNNRPVFIPTPGSVAMVWLAWPWLYQFLRDQKMVLLGF